MDLFGSNKKQNKTANNHRPKSTVQKHLDTQADPIIITLDKPSTNNTSNSKSMAHQEKHKINIKQLIEILWNIKQVLQQQLHQILNYDNIVKDQTSKHLLRTSFFRFQTLTQTHIFQRYEKTIQSTQMLISKLKNNQSIKQFIYVRNAQQFLIFFKSLFSKPYLLFKISYTRKLIEVMWDNEVFHSKKIARCLQNIKLWIYGIALPANPAAIHLHQLALSNPTLISKCVKFSKNDSIYAHVDRSDTLGLTPLMLAVISDKIQSVEKLIKAGCDIFCCPLTFTNAVKEKRVKECRLGKTKILIEIPLKERKQINSIEYLLSNKKYKQLAKILFFDEMKKLKNFRNDKNLQRMIQAIPNCSFQIQWKTYKGFISFKTLPQDIVSVYKKNSDIRIDFHVDNFQNYSKSSNLRHFSLLIKAKPNKSEFYLINHHNKKITDLFKQISPDKVKYRYESFISNGNVESQQIVSFKSQIQDSNNIMQALITFAYDSVSGKLPTINNIKEYEQKLIDSDLINYKILQKSQLKSAIMENICKLDYSKQKIIKNNVNIDIEWKKQQLNLQHLHTILEVLSKQSTFFKKINKITSIFQTETLLKDEKYQLMLPYKAKLHVDDNLSIQAQIKNIMYGNMDSSVFTLEYRAKQYDYGVIQENFQLDSLRSTIILDQNCTLNVSRFLGLSQKVIQQQEEEANKKFQQLLNNQMSNHSDDSSDNQQRIATMVQQ